MEDSMPPHPPRNPNPNSSSSMPPPPPSLPSPPSPSSLPEVAAGSRPEESAAAEEGSAKPSPSPPPPPKPSPSPQLDEEPVPGSSAEDGPLFSGLSVEEGSAKPSPSPGLDEETVPGSSAEGAPLVSGLSAEEAEKTDDVTEKAAAPEQRQQQQPRAPYEIPIWSAAPSQPFFLEVTKNGIIFGRLDVSKKGVYFFGRMNLCDFKLEDPSISRFHAVIQFRENGEAFLYDLGSKHGSFVNKTEIEKRVYAKLHIGDIISFGKSLCLYTFGRRSEPVPLDGEDISGIKSKRKSVEEKKNPQRNNSDLRDDDGCNRDSLPRNLCSRTTIDSLSEDLILEVFLHLPSLWCVIRAACSCPVWKNAVASSPLFRRKFLEHRAAPLLGLFFDSPSIIGPAFPAFAPARDTTVDVPVAVRWGDFFTTELQRQPVLPPNWSLSDVRGGLMLLVNPDDMLLVVDPLRGQSEGLFDPHEVRILMDYRGTAPRVLQAHLVCDEAYTGRFTLICFAHDISRVRAAVFGSAIGGRGFILPWFEVAPRENQLDEEDGWLTEGVQAGKSIYWLSRNHQYVVVLNTTTLVFSVQDLPNLNLDNLDNYAFGETRNGKLCLAYTHGSRLVIMCSENNNNVSGPWDILHEALLQDLAFVHGELRVACVRNGIAYLMASRGFYQYGIPSRIATYDLQIHKVEVKCQWMSSDNFQPFHLSWPRFLSSQGQASAEKARRHFQKFEKMEAAEDIILVKAIYSCQIDVMKNPHNYQAWYKYLQLEKKHGDKNKVRDVFEKALSILPDEDEKWFWESYISLWLSYATHEENSGNIESARKIYSRCLGVIPHQRFTFSAVWITAANLEIRQKDVDSARQILREGIEKRPTPKLYRKLIDIEYRMNNNDVWRGLFETFIELYPESGGGWLEYAEREHMIGEAERARAVYERAIQQPLVDLPMEVLMKDYLYFEISENEPGNARILFEKLLLITNDVEAWINYAKYEASVDSNNTMIERIQKCKSVFKRALGHYSNSWELNERAKLIQAWTEHEKSFGACGAAISPDHILSSTLKRKSSSQDAMASDKRRKKDGADEQKPH